MSRTGVYDLTHGFIPDDDIVPEHPQTNAGRLRSMTDEELARFINFTTCCPNCPAKRSCPENYAMPDKCVSSLLSWLKSPVEEVDNGT